MKTATLGELIERLANLCAVHGPDTPVLHQDDDTDWLLGVDLMETDYSQNEQAVILRTTGYFAD